MVCNCRSIPSNHSKLCELQVFEFLSARSKKCYSLTGLVILLIIMLMAAYLQFEMDNNNTAAIFHFVAKNLLIVLETVCRHLYSLLSR